MNIQGSTKALRQVRAAEKLRLFLDYDGTLADFAPTPDEIYPDPELIDLLDRLQKHECCQIAIISGRRLSHISALIPISGIILAGTYGIEFLDPSGTKIDRVDFGVIRPALDRLKPRWQDLVNSHPDLYLEDKGWSLAIHARFADECKAEKVLQRARELAQRWIDADEFRILGGDKFLEAAPKAANKGETVAYLLEH